MKFRITKSQWIGIGIALIILITSFFFIKTKFFFLILGISLITGAFPFVLATVVRGKIEKEKERMFLEFTRNLVESVKAGIPVSKSIVNVRNKSYGVLSPHVKKLVNQILLGIPLRTGLQTFSKDIGNPTISRALTLISEAEKAGGDIGHILESVAEAVNMSDKLKKERKSAISNLIVQGYIIFFIFIVIVIVMQFKIIPMMSGISGIDSPGIIEEGEPNTDSLDFSNAFLYLLITQGFFSGLVIGMLSEGNLRGGIKHSFILMISAFLISTTANLLIG